MVTLQNNFRPQSSKLKTNLIYDNGLITIRYNGRAKLLAALTKNSDDWLYAIPISSCGLRLGLDHEEVRIIVSLHLGAASCESHS